MNGTEYPYYVKWVILFIFSCFEYAKTMQYLLLFVVWYIFLYYLECLLTMQFWYVFNLFLIQWNYFSFFFNFCFCWLNNSIFTLCSIQHINSFSRAQWNRLLKCFAYWNVSTDYFHRDCIRHEYYVPINKIYMLLKFSRCCILTRRIK